MGMVSEFPNMSSSATFLPYAVQCAEIAARRESARVREDLQRRLVSLASIASTAAFVGFFGMVLGILNSFRSMTGSRSAILGAIAYYISEAMVPGLLGLIVALLAFWSYQYLRGRMEAFDVELENTTVQLVNRLIVHLGQLKSSDPAAWSVLSRRPISAGVVTYSQSALNDNQPNFRIGRMYPHGLLELVWPGFACELDRTLIREAGAWVCAAYGIGGCLTYGFQHRLVSGLAVLCFFVWAGAMIRKGRPREAAAAVITFFALALVVCFLAPYGSGWWGAFFCVLAVLPFPGVCRAAVPPLAKHIAARFVLGLMLLGAGTAMLFGNVLGLYETEPFDHSMEPTLVAGDWMLGESVSTTRQVFRGELLEVNIGGLSSLRVAGVPGDRIQIKNGHLIRNGMTVPEPYCEFYSGPDGDFPLPSEVYADESLRWRHQVAYRETMKAGEVYTVPAGSYFMLNDNRKQLTDSRTMGPITREYFVARLIASFPNIPNGLVLPRMVR